MHIYCKKCKKHTGNTFPKKLILISKNKIKGKSRCNICLTERTFIDKIEDDLESELEIYLQFFIDWCYKKWRLIVLSVKKILIILILKYLEQQIIDYCNQKVVFEK